MLIDKVWPAEFLWRVLRCVLLVFNGMLIIFKVKNKKMGLKVCCVR